MKELALRYLRQCVSAVLLAVVVALFISGIGWLAGWRAATQFSNGLSGAGSIIVALGFLSLAGGLHMRGGLRVPNRPPDRDINRAERAKMWATESIQGFNPLVLLGITGLFLIGVSLLI